MTQQIINLGEGPDTQTGDTIYVAFTKVNQNFDELYGVFGPNGGTNLQGNTITANYFVTTGNVRTGNLIAYGNIETIGNIVGSGFFYPNGLNIVDQIWGNIDLTRINSNIVPAINGLTLGNITNQFSQVYLSDNIVLTGSVITTDGEQLFINGVPAASSYSNSNVAGYLPVYSGNLDAVNEITANVINVDTNINVSGTVISSNLQVSGTSVIDGNLTVKGNLSVDGNVTYINVENLTIEDPIITLNTGPNGSPLTANVNFDTGVKSYYFADDEARSSFFGRKDDSGYFEYYSNVVTDSNNIVSGTLGTIRAAELIATGDVTATTFYGNIVGNVTGNLTAAGSNTQVLFNDNGVVGADSGLTFDKDENLLSVGSNVSTVNLTVTQDVTVGGKVSILGNIVAAIVNAAGAVLDTLVLRAGLQDTPIGNAISNSGSFTTLRASTSTVTQILEVNANATINGTTTTTNLSVTGNSYLGNVGNVQITGGSADQYLATDGSGNLAWRSFANSNISVDQFTSNGVQTQFGLSVTPTSSNYVLLNINGVVQLHNSYSINGNVLTISIAPPSGIMIEAVIFTLASGGTTVASASKAAALSMLLG